MDASRDISDANALITSPIPNLKRHLRQLRRHIQIGINSDTEQRLYRTVRLAKGLAIRKLRNIVQEDRTERDIEVIQLNQQVIVHLVEVLLLIHIYIEQTEEY
jgi:hypothetical protein